MDSIRQLRGVTRSCFFKQWNPSDPSLRSIVGDVHATTSVNIDQIKQVGMPILNVLKREPVQGYITRRKDKA